MKILNLLKRKGLSFCIKIENVTLHEFQLYSPDNNENNYLELSWNVLGMFYENTDQRKNNSENRIDYTIPREYIWARRGNLNGAELKIGYVRHSSYLRVVNAENEVLTGDELISGSTVN